MAHPNKAEGITGHNAKLKRFTQDYGAANSAQYKTAPVDKLKKNGPEDAVGYGAEDGTAKARGDRKARSTTSANPIATYKKGGRVAEREKAERRAEGGRLPPPVPLPRVEPKAKTVPMEGKPNESALMKGRTARAAGGAVKTKAMGGGVIGGQVPMRADGGRVRKGTTSVNIIVAPQQQPQTPPPVLPVPGAGGPPLPDAAPPPPPAGPPGAPPGAEGPMGGLPPGMMAPGAIPPGLIPPRAKGGRVGMRARGGRMTAGAESGPGRLEKTANRARRQAGDKGAEV